MSLNQRIRSLYFFEKNRGENFAKKSGLSKSLVSITINTDKEPNPTYKNIKGIFEAYPSLNHRWFYFGDGAMFNESGEDSEQVKVLKTKIEKLEQNQKLLEENLLKMSNLYFSKIDEANELVKEKEELYKKLKDK